MIFTCVSSTKGKCISCRYYETVDSNWLVGSCISTTTKVQSRFRMHNSRACCSYRQTKTPPKPAAPPTERG